MRREVTTATALLTNKAYGYPTRGAQRRVEAPILACIHITGNRRTIFGREPTMVLALAQAVIALVVAFGLSLAPDQIGAILAVTAVILGLITRSRVSPVS